jgi:hypothetical protein
LGKKDLAPSRAFLKNREITNEELLSVGQLDRQTPSDYNDELLAVKNFITWI